jgi:RNA polymerase sigma-70 factor (ECF subfamily)
VAQDDKRLAKRIQTGERRAFEEFLDAYGGQVHRLARRYAATEADAEDLTQEIFLDLYRCIGSFRGESKLSTWVYRVAVNHCLKHRARTRPEHLLLEESLQTAATNDGTGDPARCAQRRELSDQVRTALDDLSPLHRDVIVLHELHGLTYAECAAALDVPVGTVKSRLSNAFSRLRQTLGGYVLGETAPFRPGAVGETGP